MSLHEKMAAGAVLKGKTAAQFKMAAQKHANASWFYGAIGAAVWYFANWKWAAIPLALAAFVALQSISATLIATKMERLQGPSR